jgi:Na+/H+ antiporter NhaB
MVSLVSLVIPVSFPVIAKGTLVCRKMEKRCDISSQVETISQAISKVLREHRAKLSHSQDSADSDDQ